VSDKDVIHISVPFLFVEAVIPTQRIKQPNKQPQEQEQEQEQEREK